jgi:MFS family permease
MDTMATKQKGSLKGYYLITFLIGLGFFTMGLMDPLYDNYIPIFLKQYISSTGIIGIIMTLDNVLAIFLIPIFSALSDRTRTRIGRRMPYIVILLPLSAIVFGLIPFAALRSLWLLIITIFFLNIFKQAVRGPVVALMPDMIPGNLRSEANGVINTMGGLATILGTVLLARLMDVKLNISGTLHDNILAYPVASLFVLVATLLLFLFVKEKNGSYTEEEKKEEKVPIRQSLKVIFAEEDKSAMRILFSLLFWFIAYQGVLPFIGLYSEEVLKTSHGTAALAAGMVGIAYAIFAIPSGSFAHKHGRKKTIRGSLLALVVILIAIFLHNGLTSGISRSMRQYTFWALLFLFGIFWVAVVTNSFPMLWQMADYKTMGIYTGLYYFFSQLASIIAPPITGFFMDIFGYGSLFLFAAVNMFIAFMLMRKVDRGEPEDDSLPDA